MKTQITTLLAILTLGANGFAQCNEFNKELEEVRKDAYYIEFIQYYNPKLLDFSAQKLKPFYEKHKLTFLPKVEERINFLSTQKFGEVAYLYAVHKNNKSEIEKYLIQKNLPTYLSVLVPSLSAYNNLHISKDGKAGYWLLSYPVASKYGLTQSVSVDSRKNASLSMVSEVAANYLSDLNKNYKNLDLVAAYIFNPAAYNRAKLRSTNHKDFTEVEKHIEECDKEKLYDFLAMLYIFGELEKIDKELPLAKVKPNVFPATLIEKPLRVEAIVKVCNITQKEIETYNPILYGRTLPAYFSFHLPKEKLEVFNSLKDSAYKYQDSVLNKKAVPVDRIVFSSTNDDIAAADVPENKAKVVYTVKSGDNLGFIAEKFDTRVSKLQYWNGIRGTRINVGQKLDVYVPKSKKDYYQKVAKGGYVAKNNNNEKSNTNNNTPEPKEINAKGTLTTYTVKNGDSLYSIAKQFPGVSSQNIMDYNGIDANIKPGQVIKIPKF